MFIVGFFVCAGDVFIEKFAVVGNLEFVKVCGFVSSDKHIVVFFDLLDINYQSLLKLVSHLFEFNGLDQFKQVVLKGSKVVVLWWSSFRFNAVCLFFCGSVIVLKTDSRVLNFRF